MSDARRVLPGVTAQPLAEVPSFAAQARLAPHLLGPRLRPVSRELEVAQDALAAALRRRVEQRAAREAPHATSLAGHLCEACLDAPAIGLQPAPWGGDMGVCAACATAEKETSESMEMLGISDELR